jgi:hypothetical protein
MEIKIGDMIQSDTGACGLVVDVDSFKYCINWNKGEPKEWSVDVNSARTLMKYDKWKIVQ